MKTKDKPPLAEAAACIADLAGVLKVTNIKALNAPWIYAWGPWRVAVNGTQRIQRVQVKDEMGIDELPPYHMAVWKNGWLLGLCTPFDGTFLVGLDGSGEDQFIEAIKAHTAELKGKK